MQIPAINPISPSSLGQISGTSTAKQPESITQTFGDMLNSLNQSQTTSDNLITQLSSGQDVDLHQVLLATEENDVNFKVAMSIRDKLVSAYTEVMHMNV
jgi:flagellar hook-basal body complex protein FliE